MDTYFDFLERQEFLEEHGRALRRRVLRDRSNPFEEYSEAEFRRRFRFRKDTVMFLSNELRGTLQHSGNRGLGLAVELQLLIALRFYATGAFHIVNGDLMGVHESTSSRIVRAVSFALCKEKKKYIKFPPNAEMASVKRGFAVMSRDNFPGILGAIDCTHIRISCPGKNIAERFYNRKNFYSLNCQMICDHEMRFTNVVVRWPGSTHDSRIFRNSNIKHELQIGRYTGHLLGDSGYACTKYLLTPVLTERSPAEKRYNKAHKRARCTIERAFGNLKKRFPRLQYGMRTKLETSQLAIMSCVILHNIAINRGEEDFEGNIVEENNEHFVHEEGVEGIQWRNRIIEMHFSQ